MILLKKNYFKRLLNLLRIIGNMKKHPTFEYVIYDENGEIIDVLNLTKKEAKEYKKDNPIYTLEESDDIDTEDE